MDEYDFEEGHCYFIQKIYNGKDVEDYPIYFEVLGLSINPETDFDDSEENGGDGSLYNIWKTDNDSFVTYVRNKVNEVSGLTENQIVKVKIKKTMDNVPTLWNTSVCSGETYVYLVMKVKKFHDGNGLTAWQHYQLANLTFNYCLDLR